jgi:hypothetical protein
VSKRSWSEVKYASNESIGNAVDCQEVQVLLLKCNRCVEGTGREETMKEMEIEHVDKLVGVSKFRYYGDMIGSGGGAEEASTA